MKNRKTSELVSTTGGRRYPLRERRAPTTQASQYMLLTDEGELEFYEEAMADKQKERWLSAVQDEMDLLRENYTYDLVELPKGKRALKNKWVYKVKTMDAKPKYNAILAAKGYIQVKVLSM